MPNVNPVVVAAVAVDAAAVGAPSVPNEPSVGVAPSCGVAPSVGVAVVAGVPKPNAGAADRPNVGAAGVPKAGAAVCGVAAACAFEAPNVKPVVAVVCGVPNENPDILFSHAKFTYNLQLTRKIYSLSIISSLNGFLN